MNCFCIIQCISDQYVLMEYFIGKMVVCFVVDKFNGY